MVNAKDLSISSGHDADQIANEVTKLVDQGKWKVCNDGRGLEREFKFKTFRATWDFMNVVADECKKTKHHPEWSNVYNRTQIRWTTHNPLGLSSRDTTMARFCDEAGEKFEELATAAGESEVKDCCGHT